MILFETQSDFFRKEATVLDFPNRRGERLKRSFLWPCATAKASAARGRPRKKSARTSASWRIKRKTQKFFYNPPQIAPRGMYESSQARRIVLESRVVRLGGKELS